MTRTELVRIMAKKSGVPESGEKIFFEIFLRKAFDLLKAGEALKVKDLGYFFLRKGKINKFFYSSEEEKKKQYFFDLIIFSETKESLDAIPIQSGLFFNPDSIGIEKEEANAIDSYFSLSIGKPAIPLYSGSSSPDWSGIIITRSESELKKLYDSKVDKMLQEIEIILSESKDDEVILIDSDSYNSRQHDLDLKENTSLDFNEDISNQIEEGSLPNIEKELNELSYNLKENSEIEDWKIDKPSLEELPADLIDNEEREKEYRYEREKEEDIYNEHETEKENICKHETDEDYSFREEKDNAFNLDSMIATEEEILGGYEYVKPAASEIEDWDLIEIDWEAHKIDDADIYETTDENGYTEIHLKASDESFTNEEGSQPNNFLNKNILESDSIKTDETGRVPFGTGLSKIKPEEVYHKRKSKKSLLIVIIFLVIIGAAVFGYFYYLNPGQSNPVWSGIAASKPVIINRNYDVPVTYPYNASRINEITEFDAFDSEAIKAGNEASSSENNPAGSGEEPKQPVTAEESGTISNQKPIRVRGYIYKLGDEYLVQVSSWRYRKNAEEHAGSLTDAGYKVIVEKGIASGETVYKVRVAGFKSLDEAKKFNRKN